jgi:hypothetical protein
MAHHFKKTTRPRFAVFFVLVKKQNQVVYWGNLVKSGFGENWWTSLKNALSTEIDSGY